MLTVDKSFLPATNAFALKINDDSMSGAGIVNGDYVIARSRHTAESGDIAVFIVGDEIMVRRYGENGINVVLTPDNEAYETRTIRKTSSDLQIAGKVIGIMRKSNPL